MLFQNYVDFDYGKRIWISLPQPDRIVLVGWLLKEHFIDGHTSSFDLTKSVYNLAFGLGAFAPTGHSYVKKEFETGKKLMEGDILTGMRDSRVHLTIEGHKGLEGPANAGFKLRIELNPRKIGEYGFEKFIELFDVKADAGFRIGRFLAHTWVTSVDVAIDYVDASVSELHLTALKQGKTVIYVGDELETVYVNKQRKPPAKPVKTLKSAAGAPIARLYDRNKNHEAHGKPPPYDGRQTTRLERIWKSRKAGSNPFLKLGDMTNVLAGLRLDLVSGIAPLGYPKTWARYVSVRRTMSHEMAATLFDLTEPTAALFDKSHKAGPSMLLQHTAWDQWKAGIKTTGLGLLLLAAAKGLAELKATLAEQ